MSRLPVHPSAVWLRLSERASKRSDWWNPLTVSGPTDRTR